MSLLLLMINTKKMHREFAMQRRNAIVRSKIDWQLTFEQWQQIWLKSGKYSLRGCYADEYQMYRINNSGSYSVGNVVIRSGKSK